MSRILVTGGTGFVGSNLLKYLLDQTAHGQKHELFGLFRAPLNTTYVHDWQNQVQWLEYDGSFASMQQALANSKPDLVFHLATFYTKAHDHPAIDQLLQSNVVLGSHLLEAMTQQGCRKLVYTTSVTEFGLDGSYQPQTLYAATKSVFTNLAQYYIDQGWLQLGVLALSDTYGVGDQRPKVLNLLKQSLQAQQGMSFNSTGNQIFDAVYIDDVVTALDCLGQRILAGQGEGLQRYQVFTEPQHTLKEAVELMLKISGQQAKISWRNARNAEAANATEHNPQEPSEVLRALPLVPGWQPQTSLEQGLRRLWTGQKT